MPLAERGIGILAIELGHDLAKVARRNLEKFPNVEVQRSSFEDWRVSGSHLDLDESRREKLLDCIAELIDSSFGGKIRKAYLNRLLVARRRPRTS